jgi:hypothetical protein
VEMLHPGCTGVRRCMTNPVLASTAAQRRARPSLAKDTQSPDLPESTSVFYFQAYNCNFFHLPLRFLWSSFGCSSSTTIGSTLGTIPRLMKFTHALEASSFVRCATGTRLGNCSVAISVDMPHDVFESPGDHVRSVCSLCRCSCKDATACDSAVSARLERSLSSFRNAVHCARARSPS